MESEERVREGSWLGSEEDRREQGVCLPPKKTARFDPRFTIPADSECLVSKVSPILWRNHRTRAELWFERYETFKDGWLTFREGFWYIRVRHDAVQKTPGKGA